MAKTLGVNHSHVIAGKLAVPKGRDFTDFFIQYHLTTTVEYSKVFVLVFCLMYVI